MPFFLAVFVVGGFFFLHQALTSPVARDWNWFNVGLTGVDAALVCGLPSFYRWRGRRADAGRDDTGTPAV